MTSPELSIVIVNWNSGDHLLKCVESIGASEPRTSYEIVIIDNCSSDHSLAKVEANYSSPAQLRIIRNTENRGFGAANNQAFELTNSDFVFLLNPDTEVAPGAIDRLVELAKTDSRIGAVGPRILNADGSVQVSVFFNPPTTWHTFFWQLKLYHLIPKSIRGKVLLGRHWEHNERRDVPMIIGAAMLLRREIINSLGGFDERFHMYAEDNELCWRMKKSNWRIVFEPAATVTHYSGQSSAKRWTADEKIRVQLGSEFQFTQKALSKPSLLANQIANCIVVSVQVWGRRVAGRTDPKLVTILSIHRYHLSQILKSKTP